MNDLVCFEYVNHRSLLATRLVRPIRLWYGSTAWYPEPQWLLEAFDVDKRATRDFAMAKISGWRKAEL